MPIGIKEEQMKLKHRVNRKGKRAVHRKKKWQKYSEAMVKTSTFQK
jgi:hypothetical protein